MGQVRNAYKMLLGMPEGRTYIGGRIILNWIVDWIQLAQDMNQWRTFLYTVMNIREP
jgi:hypothetical protein